MMHIRNYFREHATKFAGSALILAFSAAVAYGSACTSSGSNLQTNPSYNQNMNTPNRNSQSYGNPSGQSETSGQRAPERPVTIMQISFEVGQVEVNQPYNVYAIVDNPDKKDIRYEWHVTGGKLLPVNESDRERLKALAVPPASSAPESETPAAPAGTDTGAPVPAGGAPATVDGKTIPATVSPDKVMDQKPAAPSGGNQQFKTGEPVPPPQLAPKPAEPTRTEPAAPPVTVASRNERSTIFASLFGNYSQIKYAVLALQDDGVVNSVEAVDSADDTADETASDTEIESGSTELERPADGMESGEAASAEAEIAPAEETPSTETDAASGEDANDSDSVAPETASDDTGAGLKERNSWPTPWEFTMPGKRDAGEKLIDDIQKQITDEIAAKEAEAVEVKDKPTVTLTLSEPFVRFIPDTAESVTVSLIIVNPKGVPLTEPTVLDLEVKTPQPAAELKYDKPKSGMDPGDSLEVSLDVRNIPDFRRGLFGVTFDVNNFSLTKVKIGSMFDGGRDATMFYAQPDKSSGLVTIAISLDDIIRTVRGSGQAATLTFEARAPIPGDIEDLGFGLTDDPNFRYIQDSAGENQLPPPASGLPKLQTELKQPPAPETPATPAAGAGEAAPGAPVEGGPVTAGTPAPAGQGPVTPGAPAPTYGGGEMGPVVPGPDGSGKVVPRGAPTPPVTGDATAAPQQAPVNTGDQSNVQQAPPPESGQQAPPQDSSQKIPPPAEGAQSAAGSRNR